MTRSPLFRLLAYASPHRRTVLSAAAASVLNKVFDLAPPLLIGMAVDVVVQRETSWLARLGAPSLDAQLLWLAALTVLIWGLESLFEFLEKWWWRNLAQTMQHELRIDTFAHLQRLDLEWFGERSTGSLLSVVNDDVNQLERFLDGGASSLLQVATTVIVCTAAFAAVSPGVTALAMLPIPLILWGSFRFQAVIAPRYAEVRERAALVSGHLADALGGVQTVKSFVAEDREVARVRALSDAYRVANRRAIGPSSAFSPLIRMAVVMGFVATLVYGGRLTLAGEMDVGAYSVLVFLTQRLLWPLTTLGQTVDQYNRAMASTARILDLLDQPNVERADGAPLPTVEGHVRFEDVRFAYPGREDVLRGVSIDIPAGHTVAIVGATGSGKSTLLRLLLRYFRPVSGTVSVDGQDVQDVALADLRRAMGLVSQSVYLFPGSVRDNVAYGMPDADDTAVRAALTAAEADGFVDALPNGWDTMIGERGQKLSGGQCQRLSLARALLTDPPILLLDEATSAVDTETERAIQRSLARVSTDRTTIVVAHRLSTVVDADRIVVLEAGQVVESGTHDDLLAAGGAYQRLWSSQSASITRRATS
ncbi:MAG: ATP-binding cassette subfamily B protein [Myxococcota bacterium]|jgi:ATP-binding cassette subfamily B protein